MTDGAIDSPAVVDVVSLRMLLATLVGCRILREQLGGRRLRLSDDDRRRLAGRGHRSGRRGLHHVQILGSTPYPDELFMRQVGRTLTAADEGVHR